MFSKLSPTRLINSIKHEHSCQILYIVIFLNQSICWQFPKEWSQCDRPFEHLTHMFREIDKIMTIILTNLFLKS